MISFIGLLNLDGIQIPESRWNKFDLKCVPSEGAIQGEPGRQSAKFECGGNVRARARLR